MRASETRRVVASRRRGRCFGGPRDGETIADRGLMFTDVAIVRRDEDGQLLTPYSVSGIYQRSKRGYEWMAD